MFKYIAGLLPVLPTRHAPLASAGNCFDTGWLGASRGASYVTHDRDIFPALRHYVAHRLNILTAVAVVATAVAAPAFASPKEITPRGVGAVKLGVSYSALHAKGLVGSIGPGCELGGPNTRSAKLRPPLKGTVDFTLSAPRRVKTISVTGGAAARGVGVGSTNATLKAAYPTATFDHSSDSVFLATFVHVGPRDGGPLAFLVSTKTKKVQLIAIPNIAACE